MSSADASLEQTLREILLEVPVNKKHKYSDVVFQTALSSLLVAAGVRVVPTPADVTSNGLRLSLTERRARLFGNRQNSPARRFSLSIPWRRMTPPVDKTGCPAPGSR